jgi:diaminohydroxyphosphoribosylaminopyrimidine deaminase/5-amino-6-(5-phosphoribosylamino)uracil reductase
MQAQAEEINEDIHLYYEKRRPFVLAKFALTLDGKIATHTGESKRITCELSRKITRDLRKNYQAILV